MTFVQFIRSFHWGWWLLWALAAVVGWVLGPFPVHRCDCDCDDVQVVFIPIGTTP